MIRVIMCGILIAVMAGEVFVAAPIPDHLRPKNPLYFPTKVGTKWTYQCGDDDVWTEVVTSVKEKDGVFLITYGVLTDAGTVPRVRQMAVSDRGLARVEDDTVKFEPPHLVLKMPHKVDETWLNDSGITYRALKPVRVKVPCGEFETICIELKSKEGGAFNDTEMQWYAPGVGLVKRSRSGRGPTTLLKAFMPGK